MMRRAWLIGVCLLSAILVSAALVGAVVIAGKAFKSADAQCTVLAVLLSERADRDDSVKLFGSLRRENPKQFDALIRRAEAGDIRLAGAVDDLDCAIKDKDIPAGARKAARGGDSGDRPNQGGGQPPSTPSSPGGDGGDTPGRPPAVAVDLPALDLGPVHVDVPPIVLGP